MRTPAARRQRSISPVANEKSLPKRQAFFGVGRPSGAPGDRLRSRRFVRDALDVATANADVGKLAIRQRRQFAHRVTIAPPVGELLRDDLDRGQLALLFQLQARSAPSLSMPLRYEHLLFYEYTRTHCSHAPAGAQNEQMLDPHQESARLDHFPASRDIPANVGRRAGARTPAPFQKADQGRCP